MKNVRIFSYLIIILIHTLVFTMDTPTLKSEDDLSESESICELPERENVSIGITFINESEYELSFEIAHPAYRLQRWASDLRHDQVARVDRHRIWAHSQKIISLKEGTRIFILLRNPDCSKNESTFPLLISQRNKILRFLPDQNGGCKLVKEESILNSQDIRLSPFRTNKKGKE